jgi:hypothetical protein
MERKESNCWNLMNYLTSNKFNSNRVGQKQTLNKSRNYSKYVAGFLIKKAEKQTELKKYIAISEK